MDADGNSEAQTGWGSEFHLDNAAGVLTETSRVSLLDCRRMNAPVAFCWGTVARTQASCTVTCACARPAALASAMPRPREKGVMKCFMSRCLKVVRRARRSAGLTRKKVASSRAADGKVWMPMGNDGGGRPPRRHGGTGLRRRRSIGGHECGLSSASRLRMPHERERPPQCRPHAQRAIQGVGERRRIAAPGCR